MSIKEDLTALGLPPGTVVLLHSSLRAMGYVCGGAVAVVQAFLDVLTPDGTLVVPAQTPENRDPARWTHPALPEQWWPTTRKHRSRRSARAGELMARHDLDSELGGSATRRSTVPGPTGSPTSWRPSGCASSCGRST
ncbi:AAC(3) family N-acetyltransferase [Solwaraspora sp. WMMB335]|uniref:AAC(3) family N-acetyltransferase n=1 Tax=Solwaraspora sp. WMMB335 TaxID=3404118 RepID=UPI003B9508DC